MKTLNLFRSGHKIAYNVDAAMRSADDRKLTANVSGLYADYLRIKRTKL